ncbi:MAG: Hsp20/alpha crystallin family protein [Calditrichota bacterium]|jgi:HSP20 family protein
MSDLKRKVFQDFQQGNAAEKDSKTVSGDERPILFSTELAFAPPTNVWESDKDMVIMMEIAHLGAGNFHICYNAGTLVIEGERKISGSSKESQVLKYHKKEIDEGKFRVKIKMNTRIVAKKISAVYENGMLTIVLPKDFREPETGEVEVPVKVAK